ncbi:MAG TPA: hypothetical protein VII94_03095 [Candidatus Saccharimonadales bacterium]
MKLSDIKLDMRVSYHADGFKPPRYGLVTYLNPSYIQVQFDDTGIKERVYPFWLKGIDETQAQLEVDYDSFCDEMNVKISAAVKLLREAEVMATEVGIELRSYDDWADLKDIVDLYIDTSPTYYSSNEWECSFY